MATKKEIILDEIDCQKIENLRIAIEVLTGKRVKFKRFDFNSGEGQIFVGKEVQDVLVEFFQKNEVLLFVFLNMRKDENCYLAQFEGSRVNVITTRGLDDKKSLWLVGHSSKDRWKEFLSK